MCGYRTINPDNLDSFGQVEGRADCCNRGGMRGPIARAPRRPDREDDRAARSSVRELVPVARKRVRARSSSAPPPPPPKQPKVEKFGPYLVHEPIGEGGMASVHRAERVAPDGSRQQVALKRMWTHLSRGSRFRPRVRARSAAREPSPPRQHRAGVRAREGRGHLLHRDGARSGPDAERRDDPVADGGGRDPAADHRRDPDRALRCARSRAQPQGRARAPARGHPSRRLAGERDRRELGPDQADRFRRREGRTLEGPHAARLHQGQAQLRRAGVHVRPARSPRGSVRGRRDRARAARPAAGCSSTSRICRRCRTSARSRSNHRRARTRTSRTTSTTS